VNWSKGTESIARSKNRAGGHCAHGLPKVEWWRACSHGVVSFQRIYAGRIEVIPKGWVKIARFVVRSNLETTAPTIFVWYS
jgi:hypothetical protein